MDVWLELMRPSFPHKEKVYLIMNPKLRKQSPEVLAETWIK